MIVMKFGGTSVGSPDKIRRVLEIVRRQRDRHPLVVVSAHAGVTDLLLDAARGALTGKNRIDEIVQVHRDIAEGLGTEFGPLEPLLEELGALLDGVRLVQELSVRTLDFCLSFGERLSSRTCAAALAATGTPAVAVDAWDLGLVTDTQFGRATPLPDEGEIAERVADLGEAIGVVTGFIGRTPTGEVTTLGRGGSDYTASLLGERIGAEEIQIWTDVDGVMSADPRIVPEARLLETLSFEEASELAYYGAKVLHPATIVPAVRAGIPVRVLNTGRPENPGTVIVGEGVRRSSIVKSIVYKSNIHLVNITSLRMLQAHGFLARIFEVFDRHRVVIDMVATSEVSVSVTTDSNERLGEAIVDLERFAEVEHRPERTVLCAVGHGMRESAGVAARLFGSLAEAGVNLEMISQGSTRINLALLVHDRDAERAVRVLHREFFEGGDED